MENGLSTQFASSSDLSAWRRNTACAKHIHNLPPKRLSASAFDRYIYRGGMRLYVSLSPGPMAKRLGHNDDKGCPRSYGYVDRSMPFDPGYPRRPGRHRESCECKRGAAGVYQHQPIGPLTSARPLRGGVRRRSRLGRGNRAGRVADRHRRSRTSGRGRLR